MRFSWKGIILAPLPFPLIVNLILTYAHPSGHRLFSFFLFFAIGAAISYGATIVLFLPSLFVLSRFTRSPLWLTVLLGTLLGLAAYFPLAWQSYWITGDNSGPPSDTFLQYLWRNFWSESWLFWGGGLVTSTLYWLLTKPRTRETEAVSVLTAEIPEG